MVTDLGSCCARAAPGRSWSKTNAKVTASHRGFQRAFIASPPVDAVQSNLRRCLMSTFVYYVTKLHPAVIHDLRSPVEGEKGAVSFHANVNVRLHFGQ